MKKQEKLQFLRNFKEIPLIENVIRPLLEKMGFKDITDTHGASEKGMDLFFYKENEFMKREYTAVQVKAVKIHGRTSQKGNVAELLNQAQLAFNHEFPDILDNNPKHIDRFMIMTSGEITDAARENIYNGVKAVGQFKSIQFIDGNTLADLADQYMPDFFWEEYNYFNRYFNEMKEDFETIKDISAIGQKETVNLEDIYVSLKLGETIRQRDLPMEIEKEEIVGKIFDEKILEKRKEPESKRERVIEPETALKQFHRMVIVGAPGAGKTTLLKHLALKNCLENIRKQERTTVPIPITLRDFFQSGKSLREYIDAVFDKYGFPEARKFVEKDLEDGKCILFLDGFDELAARENQEKVTKEIHDFVSKYHGSRVVATSRPAGYHDELAGFTRLEVMEFDEDQIERFIENWFGKSGQNKAQSLLKVVTENENIKTLAGNPLMVAIIAIIYEEDRELPNRRVDLYKRAVDVLLSRWDLRKKLKNRFKPDQKEFILRKLAFQSHCRNSRVMKETEIFAEIDKYSARLDLKEKDAQPFLEEIWQRSYLLRQIAVDTYDFLHLSFQEYFTALELKEQQDGIGAIIEHIAQPWWEEPILLYAGISKDAGPLITRIQKEVPEDMFYSNLMLAGKCIADAEFTDPDLKETIAQKLWSLYQNGEFPLLKEIAMDVLRRMKPRGIIDSLVVQLNDDKAEVRESAAKDLGTIGSSEAVPSLLIALTSDKDTSVRSSAVEALGAIGSSEAVPALLKALTSGKDSYVRRRAAKALGAIGSSDTVPALLKALTADKDRYVRGSAADALRAIGSRDAVSALLKALTADKDTSVRQYAADALGVIGSRGAVPELLKALSADKDSSVRGRAASALGAIGRSDAVPALLKVLSADKGSSVRGSAADALGAIGSRDAVPALLKALTADKDSYVRRRAAKALGAIGSRGAVPELLKALSADKYSSVRGRAASALGAIGSRDVVPALIKALTSDKDTSVRNHAADALGAIGSRDAASALLKALTSDKESYVRWHAAFALGARPDNTVTPSLLNALEDEEETNIIRITAYGFYKIKVKDAAFESLYKISRRLGVRIVPEDRRQKTEDG